MGLPTRGPSSATTILHAGWIDDGLEMGACPCPRRGLWAMSMYFSRLAIRDSCGYSTTTLITIDSSVHEPALPVHLLTTNRTAIDPRTARMFDVEISISAACYFRKLEFAQCRALWHAGNRSNQADSRNWPMFQLSLGLSKRAATASLLSPSVGAQSP